MAHSVICNTLKKLCQDNIWCWHDVQAVSRSPVKGDDIMCLNDIFIVSQIIINSLLIIKIIKDISKWQITKKIDFGLTAGAVSCYYYTLLPKKMSTVKRCRMWFFRYKITS